MGAGEWVTIILGILSAVAAIAKLGRDRWTLQRALRAGAKAIESFKEEMAAADDPDAAKGLTSRIKENLAAAGPAVEAAHNRELAKAGANITAILAPVIARLARPPKDGGA